MAREPVAFEKLKAEGFVPMDDWWFEWYVPHRETADSAGYKIMDICFFVKIECCCGLCKGNPQLYHYTRDDGTSFEGCGGYAKHVHGVTYNNVPEILQMIKVQDNYFNEMLDC